jgi:hypothetical protein
MRRTNLHPLEVGALWVIAAHLCFLPWALGGMKLWAQVISLALSVLSFVLALWPRHYTELHTGSNAFRLVMWPKLIRFPIFWTGLALLGLILVQALNPAWEYHRDNRGWWMEKIAHISWLPTGVIAPFKLWDQWRMLLIYGSGWLTICAIWVAFTRRRTLQYFLYALAANGLLIALFGIAQRVTKATKIYWLVDSPNPSFFGSFVYKNHGGFYLDLALAITGGLTGWLYLRGLRRLEKSNPSGVLAFFATIIAIAILISYARGATVVMLVFLLGSIGAFLIHQIILPKDSRKPIIAIALILISGYFLNTGLDALRSGEAWDRLHRGITEKDDSLESREMLTAAASDMLSDYWKQGAGAGGFKFLFPPYENRFPKLKEAFWQDAHNDLLQFPIELGAIGCGLLVIGAGYWVYALVRARFWQNPVSACLVFGAITLLIYRGGIFRCNVLPCFITGAWSGQRRRSGRGLKKAEPKAEFERTNGEKLQTSCHSDSVR